MTRLADVGIARAASERCRIMWIVGKITEATSDGDRKASWYVWVSERRHD